MAVRSRRWMPALVPMVFLAIVPGCATNAAHSSPVSAAPSTSVPISSSPAEAATSGSPTPEECSDNPPATNIAKSTGSGVEATVLKQVGPSSQWDIALPSSTAGRVPELTLGKLPGDFDAAFKLAYEKADAFTYGGMVLQLHLSNPTRSKITVFDLRPVNMRMVCMPAGLLVLYGSEGGDFIGMTMNLEASRPVAHERNPDDGNVSIEPYFASHTIVLPPGGSEDVDLDITVAKRAYAFDLALDYVTEGGRHTELIDRAGHSFRAAASMCPSTVNRATLSTSDGRRLRSQHFDKILQRTGAVDADGRFTVTRLTTEAYLKKCDTW
jgi:hypothetical protein